MTTEVTRGAERAGKIESSPRTGSRILIIEDDDVVRGFVGKFLAEHGYDVTDVETGEDGLRALERQLYDVVLLDLNLPGMHGMNVLAAAPATQTDAQFIVMTGFGDLESAVEALRSGAFHYLVKPVDPDHLLVTIQRALEEQELRRELALLRRETGKGIRERLVGKAPTLRRMFDLIERVAPTRSTVLIIGETGSGKELVARAIHDLSPRSKKPFVPVNCSALPETLLESELFGHIKGSFTGAIASRRGLFEEAHGGTLFLDEISTISHNIQVKLLRVLEEKRITRVGGGNPVPVDFRLVCATNTELAGEVEAGRFREDLFYRIDVFPIRVPPLRERKSDIPLLANHFRLRFAEENGVEPPGISSETLTRMMDYDWPGNVRELENFIERSLIRYGGAGTIRFDPPGTERDSTRGELVERARAESWNLDRLEREFILATLEETEGHQSRAADILGIDRRTLYRKLKRYREEGPIPPEG